MIPSSFLSNNTHLSGVTVTFKISLLTFFLGYAAILNCLTDLDFMLPSLIKTCKPKNFKLENLSSSLVKRHLRFTPVPDGREWTVGLASELLNLRSSELEVDGFSFEELDEMLTCVCRN